MQITKQYRTETGHRLMDYDGKCSHAHGHSYLWEVTVGAEELDGKGMVADFKDVKAAMVMVLEPLDHAFVLRDDDPLLYSMQAADATNGEQQNVLGVPFNPTAENFARWAACQLQVRMLPGIHVERVRVWETATSYAEWNR